MPRMMASFLRYGVTAVALIMLLLCVSCEKHPIGQMPEVQREQPDPSTRVWTRESEGNKSESSPKPAEADRRDTR
jgi:hypothetical protein